MLHRAGAVPPLTRVRCNASGPFSRAAKVQHTVRWWGRKSCVIVVNGTLKRAWKFVEPSARGTARSTHSRAVSPAIKSAVHCARDRGPS